MSRWLRRALWSALGLVALLYGGAVAWLRVNETGMVFQPDAYGGREQIPVADSLGIDPEIRTVRAADGVGLATWVVRAADSAAPWVLLCHGNAGNITLLKRQRFYRDAAARGIGVVAFDYRSYGASDDAPLSEDAVYSDASAVYRFLTDSLAVPPWRIVLYGHSLGSGVASYLARQVPAAGLILEGAFTSVPEVGQERFPLLPIRRLARSRFDNIGRLHGMTIPVLLLHARDDRTIPFAHATRLYDAAPPGTRLVDLAGDHDSAWEADRDRYLDAFAGFVRLVTSPPSIGPHEP